MTNSAIGTFARARRLIIGVGLAAMLTAVSSLSIFDGLRAWDTDLLHLLRSVTSGETKRPDRSRVAVVAIDEKTYVTPPFAGLPKVMWTPQIGAVQDAVLAGGATAFAWDVILPTSAATYVADRRFDAPLLRSLKSAKRAGRVVLGTAHFGNTRIEPHRLFTWSAGGAANLRSLNAIPDVDGVVRRIPTFMPNIMPDGTKNFVPSMALELVKRASHSSLNRTDSGQLVVDGKPAPGVSSDMLLLNYNARTQTIPTFSFADLYACAQQNRNGFFKRHFKDRVVLFGLVLNVEDRKLSSNRFTTSGQPIGPEMQCLDQPQSLASGSGVRGTIAGVYLHAIAVENLLSGEGLRTFTVPQQSAWTFLVSGLVSSATMLLSLYASTLFLLLALIIWSGIAVAEFSNGLQHPFLFPVATSVLGFAGALMIRFLLLDQQTRFLRRAFASYVAPALIEKLEQNPGQLQLGGERRDMSFLFTDLAGFTTLVEGLPPEEGGCLLNSYLDGMIDTAKSHGGTIDKIVGDALVVLFAAPVHQPNHSEQALACALALDNYATRFAIEQRMKGVPFGETRIGVHSGAAIIGNFGGSGFFDYTAHGDAVNTAARLESVNKQLGTRIAVSGETTKHCDSFVGRLVGSLVLKGKSNKIDVYSPTHGDWSSRELTIHYERAFALMAKQDDGALDAFRRLCTAFPDDPLSRFHYDRLLLGETGIVIALEEK